MYEICDYQIPPHLAFARPGKLKIQTKGQGTQKLKNQNSKRFTFQ